MNIPNRKLYYTAPSDEIFEEVKRKSIAIWMLLDGDEYEINNSIEYIQKIKNIKDNMMFIVAMFDNTNIQELFKHLSLKSKNALVDRAPETFKYFII